MPRATTFFRAAWTSVGNSSWAQDVAARGVGAVGKNTARRIMIRRQARNCLERKIVIRRRAVVQRTASNRRSSVGAAARHIARAGGDYVAPFCVGGAVVWRSSTS